MRNRITHISLRNNDIKSIYAVKLYNGDYLYIQTIKYYIDMGFSYFYIDKNGKEKEVEIIDSVHYDSPYIHTKNEKENKDSILSLTLC